MEQQVCLLTLQVLHHVAGVLHCLQRHGQAGLGLHQLLLRPTDSVFKTRGLLQVLLYHLLLLCYHLVGSEVSLVQLLDASIESLTELLVFLLRVFVFGSLSLDIGLVVERMLGGVQMPVGAERQLGSELLLVMNLPLQVLNPLQSPVLLVAEVVDAFLVLT